jgi:outer membrane protein
VKKIWSIVLAVILLQTTWLPAFAVTKTSQMQARATVQTMGKIKFAFVFDGPNDKNKTVMETFKTSITKSLQPDYQPIFDDRLVFTGDWTQKGAINASNKALNSSAMMVVSLGYMSSNYLANKPNKGKFVTTIDQYGLRDLGPSFFNPVQESVNDFILFKKLVPSQHKTAILMNENFYKLHDNWNEIIANKFKAKNLDLQFEVVPVNTNVTGSLNKIPKDVDTAFVTPLFNLSTEQRKLLYSELNAKKLPTFSSMGREDVELGALLGNSAMDFDRKVAEATSFNIHSILHGAKVKPEQIPFYDDKVISINTDTAEMLGYVPPLRLLNNAQVVSHKKPEMYDLSTIFTKYEQGNKDVERQKYLVRAARRAEVSAALRYLPTLRMDLGYQSYNDDYAQSYSNVPTHIGQFTLAMDQVIYSPDLVTNIIVKNKRLKFQKEEEILTQQNVGLQVAMLYVETLMLENAIKIQEEDVKESRENLAIARVREKTGVSGKEETLRWAGRLSYREQKLLSMKADYNNLQISINNMLYQSPTTRFELKPMKADDPAFFTSDIHIIDHVRDPQKLEKFTQMLVTEAIRLSPETAKLRAAIAMKKAEMGNYIQKFVLPDAKLSLEYGTQFDRNLPYEMVGHRQMATPAAMYLGGSPWLNLNTTSGRVFVGAEWKPIEGGHKFAEIARCKAELDELYAHEDQVNLEIESQVRSVINRALAKYFMIEKDYKAMFADQENYKLVKVRYLEGKAPVAQMIDAQDAYLDAKLAAMNSQYDFFKELLWVQRALISVNWAKASPDAKKWIQGVPKILPAEKDFAL